MAVSPSERVGSGPTRVVLAALVSFQRLRAGSDRLESSLPNDGARRPSESFRKRSIPFQFVPKVSPLHLDVSKAYDRICEFASLPAERATNLCAGGRRSGAVNQHIRIALTSIRGCEGATSAQGRGGFEGSGQGRSPLRLWEHIKNITCSSCQEIVLRGRVEACADNPPNAQIISPPAAMIQLSRSLL